MVRVVNSTSTDMAMAAGEFAQAIAELSSSEEGLGPQLAGSLAGLAAVERKVQELQDKQAEEDAFTIMATGMLITLPFPRNSSHISTSRRICKIDQLSAGELVSETAQFPMFRHACLVSVPLPRAHVQCLAER